MGVQLGSIEAARCNEVATEAQPSVMVLTGEPGVNRVGHTCGCVDGAEIMVRAMVEVDVSSQ